MIPRKYVNQDPGNVAVTSKREWARLPLSVPSGDTGQQWHAMDTGTLAAADLGDVVCGTSPLGGGFHQPTMEPPSRWSTNQRTIIPKKFLQCCKSSKAHIVFSSWGSGRGTENPRNLTLKASGIWLQNFHRTGETDSWRAQKTLCAPRPRRKEQWPQKRLS